jgi:hypothetical protein
MTVAGARCGAERYTGAERSLSQLLRDERVGPALGARLCAHALRPDRLGRLPELCASTGIVVTQRTGKAPLAILDGSDTVKGICRRSIKDGFDVGRDGSSPDKRGDLELLLGRCTVSAVQAHGGEARRTQLRYSLRAPVDKSLVEMRVRIRECVDPAGRIFGVYLDLMGVSLPPAATSIGLSSSLHALQGTSPAPP